MAEASASHDGGVVSEEVLVARLRTFLPPQGG